MKSHTYVHNYVFDDNENLPGQPDSLYQVVIIPDGLPSKYVYYGKFFYQGGHQPGAEMFVSQSTGMCVYYITFVIALYATWDLSTGGHLSKQQRQSNNIIKKLKVKDKESENLIYSKV